MSLKTLVVRITDDNRDKGKSFLITEMPAAKAEKWAYRFGLALARAGVNIPASSQGMLGISFLSTEAMAMIPFEDAEPLLDEMFECITFLPDPMNHALTRPLVDSDTEEVITRMKLRKEVIELHTGFFSAAARSKSTSEQEGQEGSQNTSTSQASSGQSSPVVKRPSTSSKQFTR